MVICLIVTSVALGFERCNFRANFSELVNFNGLRLMWRTTSDDAVNISDTIHRVGTKAVKVVDT